MVTVYTSEGGIYYYATPSIRRAALSLDALIATPCGEADKGIVRRIASPWKGSDGRWRDPVQEVASMVIGACFSRRPPWPKPGRGPTRSASPTGGTTGYSHPRSEGTRGFG